MALQRLVETYRPSSVEYESLQKHRITEDEIKKINYGKLTEAVKKNLEEDRQISLKDKTVWRFPISRFDMENANGRVYEKRLWDRVLTEQQDTYQGNVGLADHPLSSEEDGLFKNSGIVWLDMGLDESNKIVWGDGVFVGPNGKLAEEILEAGGRIGFSSSGLGELNESDNKTVKWDTYVLERPADIVLNPSQRVYGTVDMKKKPDIDLTKNAVEVQESVKTTSIKENMEKKATMKTLSKIEEKKIRRDLSAYLEEAATTADPRERLAEYQEILTMCEGLTDQKEVVEAKIAETEKLIESRLLDSEKIADTFGTTDVEALKEGVKKVVVDAKLYERQASDWKTIAEGLQKKLATAVGMISTRPTVEAFKEAIESNKKLHMLMKRRAELYEGKLTKVSERLAKEAALQEKMTEQLTKMSKELEATKKENARVKKIAEGYKATLNEYESKIEEAKKARNAKMKETPTVAPKKGNISVYGEATSEVLNYYKELEARHGNDITPFKESILNCKKVYEAMRIYTKALTQMNPSNLSEQVLHTPVGNKALKEASTPKGRSLNLPSTWE